MTRFIWLSFAVLFFVGCGSGGDGKEGIVTAGTIGPEGGELRAGRLVLEVPPGALYEDIEISVSMQSRDFEGYEAASQTFEFSPSGTYFAIPATLRIELDEAVEGAGLYHGEELGGPVERVEATIEGRMVEGEIDGFSFYVVLERPGSDGEEWEFIVDGERYSPVPVLSGEIEGYADGRDEWTEGIWDGTTSTPARVWYDDDLCISFRSDGTAVVDVLGSKTRWADEQPLEQIDFMPGEDGANRRPPTIPMVTHAGSKLLAASWEQQREAALRTFRWGVRLEEDGSVYEGFRGYEYGMLWLEGAEPAFTQLSWDPETNGPASSAWNRKMTTAVPEQTHYCTFFERPVGVGSEITPHDRCTFTEIQYEQKPARLKRCFGKGMLNGEYRLYRPDDDSNLVVGRFKNDRPVGEWTFNSYEGDLIARGSFADNGVQQGTWQFLYEGRLEEVISYSGTLEPTPVGHFLVRLGPYEKWDRTLGENPKVFLREKGQFRGDKRHGKWTKYDPDGCIERETLYDADVQLPTGEVCWRVDGEESCVPKSRTPIKQVRDYAWDHCPGGDFVGEINYDHKENISSSKCYELTGTCHEPKMGAARECPTVTCQ